jgi:sortase A
MSRAATQKARESTRPPRRRASKPLPSAKRPKGHLIPLVIGIMLLVAGVVGLGYGAFNLVVTNVITSREQGRLADRFEERKALADEGRLGHAFDPDAPAASHPELPTADEFDSPDDVPIMVGVGRIDPVANIVNHPDWLTENPPPVGDALGRIVIPQIGLDWTVVHGVGVSDLRKGPGHMPRTPVPGQYGNSVISGHRTTYGAPFNRLDELGPGDRITVETLIGAHVYEVVDSRIVAPTDVWVVQPMDGAWLTLTTCHPKFSAQQRLIVFAKLVDGPNVDLITAVYGTEYVPPNPPAS